MTGFRFFAALVGAGALWAGPYDIVLHNTPVVPTAEGTARMVSAPSPFGIAVTPDGHARYDIELQLSGLPSPGTLGAYRSYVAWEATPDLKEWIRLGVVGNGVQRVGTAEFNKFLLVITAEPGPTPVTRSGPTVLHGTSPSGWLQTFLTHPLFRGAEAGK